MEEQFPGDMVNTNVEGLSYLGKLYIRLDSMYDVIEAMGRTWHGQLVDAKTPMDALKDSLNIWEMEWRLGNPPPDVSDALRDLFKDL